MPDFKPYTRHQLEGVLRRICEAIYTAVAPLDLNGLSLRDLTIVSSDFDPRMGRPGKRVLQLSHRPGSASASTSGPAPGWGHRAGWPRGTAALLFRYSA